MRFLREIQPGDAVGTYDPNTRVYLLGKIVGQPEWREGLMPRVRKVNWTHQTLRDGLSVETRNGLGSIASFFPASQEASDELWAKATPLGSLAANAVPAVTGAPTEAEDAGVAGTDLRKDVREKS